MNKSHISAALPLLLTAALFLFSTPRGHAQEDAPAAPAAAEEDSVSVQFKASGLRDVLEAYERLTGRKVWLALDVWTKPIDVKNTGPMTRREAAASIRGLLLERYGIEVRDSGATDTFVMWSASPTHETAKAKIAAPEGGRRKKVIPAPAWPR